MSVTTSPLPRRLSLRGASGVWIVTSLIAGISVLLFVASSHMSSAPPLSVQMPWWLLAGVFAVVEAFVVHVQFGRETESFSLSEIPLVLGLFFVSPSDLVLAQLVGAAIALAVVRRQAIVKLAFNLALFALTALVASLIFHGVLDGRSAVGAHGWVAAFAATAAAMIIGVGMVVLAISLSEGSSNGMFPRVLWIGAVVGGTNTSLALVGVSIVNTSPSAAWLLLVPAATLFFAYRSYTSQRQRNASLQLLYESTRSLQRSLKVEETMHALLAQARDMLRADIARVTLFPVAGEGAQRTTLGPGDGFDAMRPVDLNPTEGVWARVASEGQGVVLAKPITSERLERYFSSQGIRDAIVTPLRGEGGVVVGTLLVGNRIDDVSTFDEEDLKLLEMLANHASTAIENARLVGRLEESLAHMTELNRLKDDFVATVSHELRTPLTSIQGFVKTLLRDDAQYGPDDQRSFLQIVERQGARLGRLIEDLLVVARIEDEPLETTQSVVSLREIANQAVEELNHTAAGRPIQLMIDDTVPELFTDEEKVHRILSNLLENAVKYSPAGAPITIHGRIESAGVVVSIEDRGIGIPPEMSERIFDRFFQVDQTATRPSGGTGLGLYICRGLAEALGGRLWLERSEQGGRGSVFSLWLPVRRAARSLRNTSVSLPS